MTTIRLHNTLSRSKEDFAPIDPQNVRMYLCGPTVYDRAHLGNARPVLVFDVLQRLLRHVYGADAVTYVRNFTDVDDKINATALARKEAGAAGTLEELIAERTEETIGWYHADMDALGAARPDHEPRATAYISEMQEMIAELIEKGFAYPVQLALGHNSGAQHVMLDSGKMPSHSFLSVEDFDREPGNYRYGALSGRSVDEMVAGARAEVGEGKRNPMDSVLWKPSTLEQPGWDSPWGRGRPGWHIECSAMSRKLLGPKFDIHGGGLDLSFPHHENELAQCRACDGDGASAKYWLHNEMLQVEGKKMSKSLGNFFTVRDLLDQGVPGEVIRFVMLSTHYRKPMDWTEKKRVEAEKALNDLVLALNAARDLSGNYAPDGSTLSKSVKICLESDLDTHGALLCLKNAGKLVLDVQSGAAREADYGSAAKEFLDSLYVLGFFELLLKRSAQRGVSGDILDRLSVQLTVAYNVAKQTKDFIAVDAMKADLIAAGVDVKISRDGIDLSDGINFDPTKVEDLL